ncbi:DMT family transporter [Colwelliaceae bacterium 6471]
MKTNPLIELIALAAIWGASFMFMRIGSPEFGPIFFMATRTLIASIFLLPLVFLYKHHRGLKGYKRKIFIVGILNTAIPFVLFGYATLTLSAGVTSILNATTPMFGAIVAYFWLKDRLTPSAIAGLCIGFIGVYLLVFNKMNTEQTNIVLPVLAVMLATLCYGISANYAKRYLSSIKPLALAAGSQLSATIALLPFAMFYLPQALPSNAAINSVILLGILCTGVAYVIFFRLISDLGPAKAMSVTYLIPAFGIFWGTIFLDEVISISTIIGCALILIGVGLTTGFIGRKIKSDPIKTG